MKLQSMINEHYVNVDNHHDMDHYKDRVWELINVAYKPIGGFLGATSVDHLVSKAGKWFVAMVKS